jgi:uncharacterized protein YndB with AHSA1/START domain
MTDPIRHAITVALPVAEAFELFTRGMGTWWPLATHSVAADTLEGEVTVESLVFEERVGGSVFEITSDGSRGQWATVLVWEPPGGFVLAWKPNLREEPATEVDVRFEAEGDATRVTLEHRGWERLGPAGAEKRSDYETGWPGVLSKFAAKAEGADTAA